MIEILLQAENSLQLGMLDQAERRYWQVLDSDPANAIAIVGLGRVALERGDERTALAFGRKALGVDPENSVARRLVGRLEEVIRERGDVVPATPEGGPTGLRPGGASPADPRAAERADASGERAGPPSGRADPPGSPGSAAPAPSAESAPPAESSLPPGASSTSQPPPPAQPTSPTEPRARRGLLDRLLGRP